VHDLIAHKECWLGWADHSGSLGYLYRARFNRHGI